MNGSLVRWGRPLVRLGVVAAACSLLACGGGGEPTPSGPNPPVLTTVSVSLSSPTIQTGLTTTATATGRDQTGAAMSLGTVAWASASPSVATVSSAGVVLGVSPGQATITATAGGKQGSATVSVEPAMFAGDFAVADARFTQGVQDVDGAIPMILSGNAAVVNVLVRAVPASSRSMQLALRIFDAGGVLIRTDTAVTQGTLSPSPTYEAPSVQFLVPASVLRPGLTWQVVRDPKAHLPDDSVTTDVFPRAGTAPLATVTVPLLRIRFVPVVLAAHGNATGSVSAGTIPEYLRTLLSVFPLGAVSAQVGTPLTTNASFGVPPSGGASPFWQQVIQELDLARLADPDPDVNWYGVVVPPPGFTFTSFGGFSYIPPNGTSMGPGTRTSAAVQINWFNNPTQARDLVGHEIGHTFGRLHAPCGGAGGPLDMSFPVFGGTLEQPGHDVFAWATGLATSARTVAATTGDVMGYCFPVWASAYTYRAVMAFRGPPVAAARQAEPFTRVLVVRGSITDGVGIALEPAFVLDARPAVPSGGGGYRVEGLDPTGSVLFAHDFEPFVLDHAPNLRPFMMALPSTPELEERLAAIVVRGPAGAQRLDRAPVLSGPTIAALRETSVARAADGVLSLTCAGGAARGILALDAATGAVLGSASRGSMRLVVAPRRELSIVCSDGVRTERSRLVAP
jgi:hypothetical protein